jgi:hypothetical protein
MKKSEFFAEELLQQMPRISERLVIVLDFCSFSVGVKQNVRLGFDLISGQDVECGLGH